MRPNFLGIGAQKCASTWLYDVLAGHPEIRFAGSKEIDFFSYWYDYGFQWYEQQFEHPELKAVGEVSPSYFHHATAPLRVKNYFSGMKLILMLREPVSRAQSNHRHEVRIGHLSGEDLSFERGLRNNPSYVEQGLYATHLERWLEHFPREQMLVILYDDLVSDPARIARETFAFLGVDEQHRPEGLTQRANESYVYRSPTAETVRRVAQQSLKRLHADWLWDAAARAGAQRLYRRLNRRKPDAVIPPMQAATKAELKRIFQPEICRLETLLERPLSNWLSE